jgi:hypothetical protein
VEKFFCPRFAFKSSFVDRDGDLRVSLSLDENFEVPMPKDEVDMFPEVGPAYLLDEGCIYVKDNVGYFDHSAVRHYCNCVWKTFARKCDCPGYASVLSGRESLPKFSFRGGFFIFYSQSILRASRFQSSFERGGA